MPNVAFKLRGSKYFADACANVTTSMSRDAREDKYLPEAANDDDIRNGCQKSSHMYG